MKTDVIVVSNDGNNMEAVLDQVDALASYRSLSPKNALHLRLLAEETLAMMRAITGDVDGEFWIEAENDVYELHLKVDTLIDEREREQLLSASTTGKNEATRGFMGKIRALFQPIPGVPVFGTGLVAGAPPMYSNYEWSMVDYRNKLRQYREQNAEDGQEAWDELEKSVVSRVANDVKVSILGRTVEMTIVKRMS
jgi:hypothetical protein